MLTALLIARTIARSLATERAARVVALALPPPVARSDGAAVTAVAPGEVPERLNGRDWKSRNGGNLVRGFESLPLR